MIVNGYALIRLSDNTELNWWRGLPERIDIPGKAQVLFSPRADWSDDEHALVERSKEFTDPEPERRMISKADILARVTDEQLDAAMSLMSTRQKERWRMPGYPNLYVDDPELIQLLTAAGTDPEVVLAP